MFLPGTDGPCRASSDYLLPRRIHQGTAWCRWQDRQISCRQTSCMNKWDQTRTRKDRKISGSWTFARWSSLGGNAKSSTLFGHAWVTKSVSHRPCFFNSFHVPCFVMFRDSFGFIRIHSYRFVSNAQVATRWNPRCCAAASQRRWGGERPLGARMPPDAAGCRCPDNPKISKRF